MTKILYVILKHIHLNIYIQRHLEKPVCGKEEKLFFICLCARVVFFLFRSWQYEYLWLLR